MGRCRKLENSLLGVRDYNTLEYCWCYDELNKNNRFYKKLVDKYGEAEVARNIKFLNDNYVVKHGTYIAEDGTLCNTVIDKRDIEKFRSN